MLADLAVITLTVLIVGLFMWAPITQVIEKATVTVTLEGAI
jgi:hypothetical protein